MSWAQETPDGVVLKVKVIPRASRTQVQGLQADAIKIRLQAQPVEGKANRALIEFLARALGLRKNDFSIVAGHTSRNKRVLVQRLAQKDVQERLRLAYCCATDSQRNGRLSE